MSGRTGVAIERGLVRFGDTPIPYQVLRSHRRKKTVEITIDPTEGVLVAAPADTACDRIEQIVRKRAGWIVRTANARTLEPLRKEFVSGESLPYLGRQVRIYVEPADINRVAVRFSHWLFEVATPAGLLGEDRREAIRIAFVAWYRRRATERLIPRVERWASIVGRTPSRVLIRDQRQRWASCGPDGALRFNWRSVLVEPTLMDYIVVHELVHIGVRAHSARFWEELSRVMPDYKLRRQRLREAGLQLSL